MYAETWSADEEERLLEAMEIYGYGSWKTISEHLGKYSHLKWLGFVIH